jgi:hypothetical protein
MGIWPKKLTNVEVRFAEVDIPQLGFKCNGKSWHELYVFVYWNGMEIVSMYGRNIQDSTPTVLTNLKKFSDNLLFEIFHMSRCKREFSRAESHLCQKGYAYHRERMLKEWKNMSIEI